MAMESMTKKVVAALVMVMVIVVGLIVLNNFKEIPGGDADTNSSIDTAKTAIQTPVTYIGIVIIIGILVWIVKEVRKAGKM